MWSEATRFCTALKFSACPTDPLDVSMPELPLRNGEPGTASAGPYADPISDGSRLAALRDLAILDTEPEECFDRFTTLAVNLLGVPISLISLIDRDRQFFKSQRGLPEPWSQARQAPLSHSFCQYTVATKRPLVIEDARRSPMVSDSLAIRDMSAIAYAGVPLVLEDGSAVGTLCAIDRQPRQWTNFELRVLADLGEAVKTHLDLRRAIAEQSLNDPVTGLPGRPLMVALCDHLRSAHRDRRLLGLAIGVDEVGAISRTYGVSHADRVLKRVARRIAWQLAGDDLLGRLEADAFIILRPEIEDESEAFALAQRVREAVCGETLTVSGDSLSVGVTVGIAYGGPEMTGEDLAVAAQEALREARDKSAQPQAQPAEGAADAAARRRIRGALRGAIERGEITVAFQPIVDLETRLPRGFEALARWHHPELGEVSPDDFIPVAETTGDVVQIGEHVLRIACRQLAIWRAEFDDRLQVTVNFSPLQLAVANIAEVIQTVLDENGVPGTALALEITEGVLLAPGPLELHNLERLRDLGIRIALDDFGTGYSTLSYLKRFAVDVIKIDRSFLDDRRADFRDEALVRAVLALGSGMQIDVVAEGVETDSQRELLHRSGCRWGQGFLFARPLPADEVSFAPPEITPAAIAGPS
jgi:diguanylate cyclase (GGDEF)-like protein